MDPARARERLAREIADLTEQLDALRGELRVLGLRESVRPTPEPESYVQDRPTRSERSEVLERSCAANVLPESAAPETIERPLKRRQDDDTLDRNPAPGALSGEAPPSSERSPDTKRWRVEPASRTEFNARYSPKDLLGEGGMGEVRLYTDRRIGRQVAMKVLLPQARFPKLRDRFLFEARIQGQLEHPSIVPVYDMGVRPDGREFFTMKRLHGQTLAQVLRALRRRDRTAHTTYTRHKLLVAFQNVCLAVEYAHRKGVLHRDLKPANIMLGTFGEVSVIDWGVAKLITRRETLPSFDEPSSIDEMPTDTAEGETLGTPGYMSPEQVLGASVTPESDIFGLGAILFEILTHQKLVPGDTDDDVREATRDGRYNARISERFPDLRIEPELEELCIYATMRNPDERPGSAKILYEAIERCLEGEAQAEERARQSKTFESEARAAFQVYVDADDPLIAQDARRSALSLATAALSLDPNNLRAKQVLLRAAELDSPMLRSVEVDEATTREEQGALRTMALQASISLLVVSAVIVFAQILALGVWGVVFVLAIAGIASVPFFRAVADRLAKQLAQGRREREQAQRRAALLEETPPSAPRRLPPTGGT